MHGQTDADHGQREHGTVQRDGRRGDAVERGNWGPRAYRHACLARNLFDRRPVGSLPAQ